MLNSLKALKPAIKLIFKDKVSLMLALIPIVIGVVLYGFAGHAVLSSMLDYGQDIINENLSNETFGKFIYYIMITLLSVALFFIVNWTFVVVLSIIASPFNDLLSGRIEKNYLGKPLPPLGDSFSGMKEMIFKTIINEIKKMSLILIISIFGFLLSLSGFLMPFSILITIILLAVGYVDYSWSRHDMPFVDCRKDIRKGFFSYALGGGIFMIIISIPLINIIVPSLATSYFTVLWIMNNEHSNKITE